MIEGDGPSALVDAVDWVEALLGGAAATTTAIIAVATLGLLMLAGRLPLRRGATVVVGCFILFSAAVIARGLTTAVASDHPEERSAVTSPTPAYTPTAPRAVPFDPYAGAAVSDRR